tara:strand:- start:590 stop:1753 length:1164 start_codon:yes stop_codon:yes gene_type:complete
MIKILFFIIFFLINPLHAKIINPDKQCNTSAVQIDFDFPGAGNVTCEIINSKYIKFFINPETDDSINPSPWFAIRKSKHSEDIKLEFDYKNYQHRYDPKISNDKKIWKKINQTNILKDENGKIIIINFSPSNEKEYISSQELITEDWYNDWFNYLEGLERVKSELIGLSVLKKPITMFFVEENTNNPYILILGRQHPPEVTGAIAIKSFVNELISKNDLSESFLDNYNIIFVPLMNPDGVENGYWRYNENKKDLNRDWGIFSQPETKSVNNKLINFKDDKKIEVFIDFHSTYKNIFYISDISESHKLQNFLKNWLNNSKPDLLKIDYDYKIVNSMSPNNGVSKNYFFNKYNIPSVTYEVSDTEDRDKIKKSSSILSQKLMQSLLELK